MEARALQRLQDLVDTYGMGEMLQIYQDAYDRYSAAE